MKDQVVSFSRDKHSGAIVNTDAQALAMHRQSREKAKALQQLIEDAAEIKQLHSRLDAVEQQNLQILSLLQQLTNNVSNSQHES